MYFLKNGKQLLIIAKNLKLPKYSLMDDWINNMSYIPTVEYYSALRREEILTQATTRVNLKDIVLTGKEARQKRQILCYFTDRSQLQWSESKRQKVV